MQTLEEFLAWREQLRANLTSHSDVIGLVFLGSAAATERFDQWSDHDFFVITNNGSAENFRQNLSWLPAFDKILFSPRETPHGLKVVYQSGHILEFAVFDDAELVGIPVTDYFVMLDRCNLEQRMSEGQTPAAPGDIDVSRELELFLATLIIGVGRARRREEFVAAQFIHTYCVNHLLKFVETWQSSTDANFSLRDSLNPVRRIEQRFPAFGHELNRLRSLPVEDAAPQLLDLLEAVGQDNWSQEQTEHISATRAILGWSNN